MHALQWLPSSLAAPQKGCSVRHYSPPCQHHHGLLHLHRGIAAPGQHRAATRIAASDTSDDASRAPSVSEQLDAARGATLSVIQAVLAGDVAAEDAAQQLAAASVAAGVQRSRPETRQQESPSTGNIMDVICQPTGVPEVVFGQGKAVDQLAASLLDISQRQRVVLATRVEPAMYAAVRKVVPGVEYNARAHLLVYKSPNSAELPKIERLPGTVAVVSAGAADQCVAEECRLVAEHLGCFAFKMDGFVVSSLHRLLTSLEALRAADVVVVVSGLDGALAPMVAGLVDAPVIAVPTSSGYGASLGGAAAMLSTLSCATPGITVCNVDNGFGGAVSAYKCLRMANKLHKARSAQKSAAAGPGAQASA